MLRIIQIVLRLKYCGNLIKKLHQDGLTIKIFRRKPAKLKVKFSIVKDNKSLTGL